MARARNDVETAKLQLRTTPQVVAALELLVKTGKFGKTSSEVGEELLRLKLREIELEGWLTSRKLRR
jgi:Arc/MetJ-type ribon-helix-helix transcriptional regulator